MEGQLLCQFALPSGQGFQLKAGGAELGFQRVRFGELAADVLGFGLQDGYLARLIVAAAVQLLFQGVGRLCIRGILIAGGDESGDAALQAGVLGNGDTGLADKGAALIDLPADTQQRFPAVLTRQAGEALAGAGVKSLEISHGGRLAAGGPNQGQLVCPGAAVHPAAHGVTVPWRVSVFISDKAGLVTLPAVDAV